MNHYFETKGTEHTPDSALRDAFLWLSRTPSGMVDVVLLTLPGRLRRAQEQQLFAEIRRVLSGDTGSLFLWGSNAGLAGAGFEAQTITAVSRVTQFSPVWVIENSPPRLCCR